MKVLVAEKIADKGVEELRKSGLEVDFNPKLTREEILDCIDQYDALVVRSVTKVNEELYAKATNLKVVGRAGNGVDNIEMEGASKRGIIVVNTPNANTVTTAEHTIGLLMASNRRIPQADAMIRRHEWDRTKFKGAELSGKTLGIIGLGRIGSLVATRMKAFNMHVIAYDPYIADERFERFGVEKKDTLEELMKEVDFLTIHTPKTMETLGMVERDMFAMAKDGLRVVNCARGGLYDEDALYEALESGKVATAAIDVLKDEPNLTSPLLKNDRVIFTPHLGADTFEAQENVGITVAQEVINVLAGNIVPNAVNLPTLGPDEMEGLFDYLKLGDRLGNLYYGIWKDPIESLQISFEGDAAQFNTNTITLAVLKGVFEPVMSGRVNYVNAGVIAEEEGIAIACVKKEGNSHFNNLLKVKIKGKEEHVFAGMVAGDDEVRINRIDNYFFDIKPTENMLFIINEDKPGRIGQVGDVIGDLGVNIGAMQCAPDSDGKAMIILSIDRELSETDLAKFTDVEGILKAKFVKIYNS
ncbi:MAG: phosphoglycerate dehydrogenase [Clostridiales bacterium]